MALRFFFGYKTSGAVPLSGDVAETLTLVEASSTAGSVLRGSVAETASVVDTPSGTSAGSAKRAYVSWIEFQAPLPRPPSSVSRSEVLSVVDQSVASGGSVFVSRGEALSLVDVQSGGGGSISAFASELLAAADQSQVVTAARVYLFWTDLQLPTTAASDAVNEVAALLETALGMRVRVAPRAELITLADAASVEVDWAGVVAESLAPADDANSIGGAYEVSAVQAIDLLDDSVGVGGVSISVQDEGPTVADDQDASVDFAPDAVDELLDLIADDSEGIVTSPATDSLLLVDECAAVIVTSGSVAERTAPVDVMQRVAVLWDAVEEYVALGDQQETLLIVPPVFGETPLASSKTGLIGGRLGTGTGRGNIGKLD